MNGNSICNTSSVTVSQSNSPFITMNSGAIVNNSLTINTFSMAYTGYKFGNVCNACIPFTVNFYHVDSFLTVSFTGIADSATNWFWNFGDGNIDTTQNPVHTYNINGLYKVCLSASNKCYRNYFCDSINVLPTNVQDYFSQNEMKIFPNPSLSATRIPYSLPQGEKGVLKIYGISGELKASYSLKGDSKVFELPVNDFAPGVYICTITAEGSGTVEYRKMVVVR